MVTDCDGVACQQRAQLGGPCNALIPISCVTSTFCGPNASCMLQVALGRPCTTSQECVNSETGTVACLPSIVGVGLSCQSNIEVIGEIQNGDGGGDGGSGGGTVIIVIIVILFLGALGAGGWVGSS